jgi:D-3-phosphoglycerate dehydrogenase / 2-oxoglutarate reductase
LIELESIKIPTCPDNFSSWSGKGKAIMKIIIASHIHEEAVNSLREQHDVVFAVGVNKDVMKELIKDCDVLVFRSGVQITADLLAEAAQLRLIVRAGSGMDNIDFDYVRERDIRLVRIPGPGARAVAEMSFALMLTLSRNVIKADELWRQGQWVKQQMTGYLLRGKVLGIVGLGNIGSQTASLGQAWGMRIIACAEHLTPDRIKSAADRGIQLVTCADVFARADYISLHVPLKDSTRYMVDRRAFELMKPGAFLINLARGGVVNEQDLIDALRSGRLAGAALDVHEGEGDGRISPLAGIENVILTPHIGANTFDTQREIGEIILETIASSQHQLPGYEIEVPLPIYPSLSPQE